MGMDPRCAAARSAWSIFTVGCTPPAGSDHTHIYYFFIRELVEDHRIRCPFVNSVDNRADFHQASAGFGVLPDA